MQKKTSEERKPPSQNAKRINYNLEVQRKLNMN